MPATLGRFTGTESLSTLKWTTSSVYVAGRAFDEVRAVSFADRDQIGGVTSDLRSPSHVEGISSAAGNSTSRIAFVEILSVVPVVSINSAAPLVTEYVAPGIRLPSIVSSQTAGRFPNSPDTRALGRKPALSSAGATSRTSDDFNVLAAPSDCKTTCLSLNSTRLPVAVWPSRRGHLKLLRVGHEGSGKKQNGGHSSVTAEGQGIKPGGRGGTGGRKTTAAEAGGRSAAKIGPAHESYFYHKFRPRVLWLLVPHQH